MSMHKDIVSIKEEIEARSKQGRQAYLDKLAAMRAAGPPRPRLSCGNLAHAFAACGDMEKAKMASEAACGIGIVTAYNDMLSAHQPYHQMLDVVKADVIAAGGVAQVAGGVPAMCDGVTQGQVGMELSLFSRDVIAMSTAIAMSHNVFDGGLMFGVCDKIVPGLLIGALSFGHLPFVFLPAGPMPTGISNSEKQAVRQKFAAGELGRAELLASEARAYHSPGTCTFYGTANSNQVMLEAMGLQIPGASFVQPADPLRAALSRLAAERAVALSSVPFEDRPGIGDFLDVRALMNAVISLLATGGSTNHAIHLVAIARAAGVEITWADMEALSRIVPLIARVYPNGNADVNAFHNAGGTVYVMQQLLAAGLLFGDVPSIMGGDLAASLRQPLLDDAGALAMQPAPEKAGDDTILRPAANPFQPVGGLKHMTGNLGEGVMKISAVKPQHRRVIAPARVFEDQDDLLKAYKAGELNEDFVAVIRFQGPAANGMPELHKLTPTLSVLQDSGLHVALVTDGRMSGASGRVPAAIHITPEAAAGGPLAYIQDGDMITVDGEAGVLSTDAELSTRDPAQAPVSAETFGRALFAPMRAAVSRANAGASFFQYGCET